MTMWKLSDKQQLQLSGFFRTYNLSLYAGLRARPHPAERVSYCGGSNAKYVYKMSQHFSLLVGFDYEREAPRRDDLDHYGFFDPRNPVYYGPFTSVDGNNVTISSLTPYVAAEGALARYFRYYLGWRRDEIDINNQDLLHLENSFQKWTGVNSPKATLSFLLKNTWYVPLISFSFGQSFFTEDPRIGTGTAPGFAGCDGTFVPTGRK